MNATSLKAKTSRQSLDNVRRAFVEFLTIPTLVIAGFLLAALVTHTLDRSGSATLKWGGLFSEPEATRDFLSVIASGIITVTTMTFSLLLIAVQQGAAALTSLVLDQFIRRKVNQFYFGFFVGLALYSLIILASMGPSHQPHLGVALAGLMTAAALYMLIFLIYSTINQMRPVVILRSIHGHTLMARTIQLDLMRRTRREPRLQGDPIAHVTAECNGFMTRLDFATIASAVAGSSAEVVILPSIGDYVTFGDPIAEIRAATPGRDVLELDRVIRTAVEVEEQRDLDGDPAFGIEQIVTIGWTSISTAKSNPDPGLLAIFDLRDLLARWVQSDEAFGPDSATCGDPAAQVVYSDNLANEVMKGFELFVVVASESMHHQCAAECYRTFAGLYPRLPPFLQQRTVDIVLRSLTGLADHILTSDLASSLNTLSNVLTAHGQTKCAKAITKAQSRLELTIGKLNSRSTRAKANG